VTQLLKKLKMTTLRQLDENRLSKTHKQYIDHRGNPGHWASRLTTGLEQLFSEPEEPDFDPVHAIPIWPRSLPEDINNPDKRYARYCQRHGHELDDSMLCREGHIVKVFVVGDKKKNRVLVVCSVDGDAARWE
jgi:hypothetical protein